MKRYTVGFLIVAMLLFSGCAVKEQTIQTGEVAKNEIPAEEEKSRTREDAEKIISSRMKVIPMGEAIKNEENIPVVVITEANSGAIVTQTGDSLIYRNEVYGFQVKLGKAWKGGQIGVAQTSEAASIQETYIIFNLPYDRKGGIPNAGAISGMDRNSIWVGQIIIQSYENHEKTENYIANLHKGKAYDAFFDEETYSSVLWKNNQYYFLGRPLSQKELELLFEWEYRKRNKDIFETLEIFDVKN